MLNKASILYNKDVRHNIQSGTAAVTIKNMVKKREK